MHLYKTLFVVVLVFALMGSLSVASFAFDPLDGMGGDFGGGSGSGGYVNPYEGMDDHENDGGVGTGGSGEDLSEENGGYVSPDPGVIGDDSGMPDPEPTPPVVSTPVPTTPVVNTPAPTTPVVNTPVPTTPVVNTPVPTTPVVNTPVPTTPVVNTPVPSAPGTGGIGGDSGTSTPAPTTPSTTAPSTTTAPSVTAPPTTTTPSNGGGTIHSISITPNNIYAAVGEAVATTYSRSLTVNGTTYYLSYYYTFYDANGNQVSGDAAGIYEIRVPIANVRIMSEDMSKDCTSQFSISTGTGTLYRGVTSNSSGANSSGMTGGYWKDGVYYAPTYSGGSSTTSAKTGDENNLGLWIAVVAGSSLVLGGAAVVIRKKLHE